LLTVFGDRPSDRGGNGFHRRKRGSPLVAFIRRSFSIQMAFMLGRKNHSRKKCRWRLDTWWASIRITLIAATYRKAETPASVSRQHLEDHRRRALAAVGPLPSASRIATVSYGFSASGFRLAPRAGAVRSPSGRSA
jgi:hypothetical protein